MTTTSRLARSPCAPRFGEAAPDFAVNLALADMCGSCANECQGLYQAERPLVMIVLVEQGDTAMRDGHTHRVCPSCGAVGTVVTCDHCGTLTVFKSTRATESATSSGTPSRTSRWQQPDPTESEEPARH